MPGGKPHDRRVVWVGYLLATCGLLTSVFSVGATIGSLHSSSPGTGRLDLAGLRFSYPSLNRPEWALLALALVGAAAAVLVARACWRQRAAYSQFLRRLHVVGHLDGHPEVNVFDDPRPQAFCAGYLRPRIYISRRTIELLSPAQLDAVLAHEQHHRRVRDPLRLACGDVLGQALFFLPALRALHARYTELAELNADRAAIAADAGRQAPLAGALLAFDASTPPGASGISSHRVDSLLGAPSAWRAPWGLISMAVGALMAFALLTWESSQAASAHATLNLPLVSSTPCVVASALLGLLGCLVIARALTGIRPAHCADSLRFILRRRCGRSRRRQLTGDAQVADSGGLGAHVYAVREVSLTTIGGERPGEKVLPAARAFRRLAPSPTDGFRLVRPGRHGAAGPS